MRSPFHVLLLAWLAACGGSTSGSEPVDITTDNLAGYWVATYTEGAATWPVLIHFEPELHPSERIEGVTRYAEVVQGSQRGFLVGYALDGDAVSLSGATWGETTHRIERLSRDELVMDVYGQQTTFRRRPGCAGPSLWSGGLGHTFSAAWDEDGGLHLVVSSLEGSGYAWVAPGRCTATFPTVGIEAEVIDVADDGDIRALDYRRNGALPGEITVTTVPARPWARAELDTTRLIVPAPSTPASKSPPLRSVDVGAGRFMVFYAYGQTLYAVTVDGAATTEEAVGLWGSSTFTPSRLEIDRLPDGGLLVRDGEADTGALYVDGVWSKWEAEVIDDGARANVFAWHDGTMYAAWTVAAEGSGVPMLRVGKQRRDGGWDVVAAGRGYAMEIFAGPRGVDVIGPLDAKALGPMVWTHVPAAFEKNTWQQELHLDPSGGIDAVAPRTAHGGRFGPDGEVFMAVDSAVWRRPHLEGDALYAWTEVDVTFAAETDVTVVFPTMGTSCTEECTLRIPPASIVPAVLELPGESAAARIVGAEPTLDGWAYAAPVPLGDWDMRAMQVVTTVRRMTDVVGLATADVRSESSDIVVTGTGYAVTHGEGALVLSVVEDGAVVREARFSSGPLGTGMLAARAGGGFALGVNSLPSGGGPGVVLLDPALEVVDELPFDGDGPTLAVTPSGYAALRYAAEGETMELVTHASSGPSAAAPVSVTVPTEARALGDDALVAFWARDRRPSEAERSESAWRRLDADGTVAWTLTSTPSESLTWAVVDGDLVVASELLGPLTIGGATYEPPAGARHQVFFAGRFDGATGAVEQHVVEAIVTNNAVLAPTTVTADERGFVLGAAFTGAVYAYHLPFAGDAVATFYASDVIAGHCLQPGVQCSPQRIAFAALGGGRYVGTWTQTHPTDYDGARVEGAATRAVTGVYTPVP
ncbi:MAG: hypothetical protein IT385_23815 [Deltaproteobacteria bacterium]|nr:hypothetical protein [Deltaproteobacteria bacterium]